MVKGYNTYFILKMTGVLFIVLELLYFLINIKTNQVVRIIKTFLSRHINIHNNFEFILVCN